MRKHFVTTLLLLLAWQFVAPASWMGRAQAQGTPTTPVGLAIPASKSGTLGASSYNAAGADYTLGPPNGTAFTGFPQDWYQVPLVAGYTYVFTMTQAGSSSIAAAMSLQTQAGTQVMWSYGEGADYCDIISQLFYTVPAGQGGLYTLVCAYTEGVPSVPYTLTIPFPTGSPTIDYPAVNPAPKNIASLATTYTDLGPITSASYYGAAASNVGSPPVLTQPLWYQSYSSIQVPPAWVMYYQNWYSTSAMTVNTTYVITLSLTTAGAGNPILSVQNSSGVQQPQAFFYTPGQATATIYFTPTVADTYYIICTQDLLGVPGNPNGCLGVNVPTTSYNFSITPVPAGSTATSVSAPAAMSTSPTATVNVTVTGLAASSGAPMGNVVVTVGSFTSGQVPVTPGAGTTSTAIVSVPTPPGGSYTVTVQFTGTGVFQNSTGTGKLAVINIIQLTVPVSYADATSPSSYSGVGADVSQMGGWSDWNDPNYGPITPNSPNGLYQNWYTVPLVGGQTYVISILYNGGNWPIMSIQNSKGQQQTWGVFGNYGSNAQSAIGSSSWQSANGPVPQLVFKAPANDTYTIIFAGAYTGQLISGYTLLIPNPAPPAPTPINLPFSGPGTFTTSSYYGAGTSSSVGAPPPAIVFFDAEPQAPWVYYFQNWYSVYLTAQSATTITMAMSSSNGMPTSPILSIQNSAGGQVNYSYTPGSNTTSINFKPTATDTYTIICSQDQTGPGGYTLTFGGVNSYTLTVTGAGSAVATTTTIFPGINLPNTNLNVTVKVTAVGGPPTGTVTLSVDDVAVGTQTLTNGSAVFNIPNPGPGNHTLGAAYSGNLPSYLPSQSATPLISGIPNTRFVPPAGDNNDRHTLAFLAFDARREPLIDPMEAPVIQYWEGRN